MSQDGGMYERELRLILNCILLQLLFNVGASGMHAGALDYQF